MKRYILFLIVIIKLVETWRNLYHGLSYGVGEKLCQHRLTLQLLVVFATATARMENLQNCGKGVEFYGKLVGRMLMDC